MYNVSGQTGAMFGKSLEDGANTPIKATPEGYLMSVNLPFRRAVQCGKIKNLSSLSKHVHFETGATSETLFSENAFIEQTGEAARSIVSTSTQDTDQTGAGVWKVLLMYQNALFERKTQVINMAGTTPINTNADVYRVESIIVIDGPGVVVDGIIYAGVPAVGTIEMYNSANGAGSMMCSLSVGSWRLESMIIYVPKAHRLIIIGLNSINEQDTTTHIYATQKYNSVGGSAICPEIKHVFSDKNSNLVSNGYLEIEEGGKFFINYTTTRSGEVSLTLIACCMEVIE